MSGQVRYIVAYAGASRRRVIPDISDNRIYRIKFSVPIVQNKRNPLVYSKPRKSRIQVDRQICPSYAKIRLIRSEIKIFGTIVFEILSEMFGDPTYAGFTVYRISDKFPSLQRSDISEFYCTMITVVQTPTMECD